MRRRSNGPEVRCHVRRTKSGGKPHALQDLADSARGRPGRASVLECVRRSRAELPLWRGAGERPRSSLPRPADEKRWQATRTPRPRGPRPEPAKSRQRLGVRAAEQSGAAALAGCGRTAQKFVATSGGRKAVASHTHSKTSRTPHGADRVAPASWRACGVHRRRHAPSPRSDGRGSRTGSLAPSAPAARCGVPSGKLELPCFARFFKPFNSGLKRRRRPLRRMKPVVSSRLTALVGVTERAIACRCRCSDPVGARAGPTGGFNAAAPVSAPRRPGRAGRGSGCSHGAAWGAHGRRTASCRCPRRTDAANQSA